MKERAEVLSLLLCHFAQWHFSDPHCCRPGLFQQPPHRFPATGLPPSLSSRPLTMAAYVILQWLPHDGKGRLNPTVLFKDRQSVARLSPASSVPLLLLHLSVDFCSSSSLAQDSLLCQTPRHPQLLFLLPDLCFALSPSGSLCISTN